jgi:kynurenine formamidase
VSFPSFAELPVRAGAPPGSSWGVFGDDDQLGTLNFIGEEQVRAAAALVRRGVAFPLDIEIAHLRPALLHRSDSSHVLEHWDVGVDVTQDDHLDGFWLQGASQWDALRHYGEGGSGFYNGRALEEVTGAGRGLLGVDVFARRGIAGRAVLLDVARGLEQLGSPIEPLQPSPIDVDMLRRVAELQQSELRQGDVLLVRMGWLAAYDALSEDERTALGEAEMPGSAGLVPAGLPEFLWNTRIAAIATDNPALEVLPTDEFELHRLLIARLGMPIGELWDLERLAADCAEDGVYEGLITSSPLNVSGGAGSPANAMVLK